MWSPCCGAALPDTLNAALARAAGSPDKGLRFLDRREQATFVGWDEVFARAQATAGRLAALGVRPGDRVALIHPTAPEFFDAFFGANLAGAVPVPLYPPVRLGRMDEYHIRTARMLQAVDARVVLADSRVRRVLGHSIEAARPPLGCLTADMLPEAEPLFREVDPDALGMVQFSSGTTVDPKPVALSHRAVTAQAGLIIEWAVQHPEYTTEGACWLPLYHDMGLIGCVFVALLYPGSLTLIGPEVFVTRPGVWLRAISRYGACISPAPNFAYALCTERITDEELEGVDLSRWTMALNGAEPVAPEVLRAFQDRFARWGLRRSALTPVYGLSEASLAVSLSEPDQPFVSTCFDRDALAQGRAVPDEDGLEIVSVGFPAPRFALKVIDPAGDSLPDGVIGRVLARGPSLMEGYLGRPEDTARALRDGWLDTGDLGFFWEGRLYLTGRAKDVLILRGRNHPPHPVEQSVDAVEGVRTGCVAAVSHRHEGAATESLLLFVEHHKDATAVQRKALPEACTAAVREATGLNCDAVFVLAPGTLPRTSSGKIRRQETLRRYLAGELSAPESVGALKLAGMMARSALAMRKSRDGR
ncbi:MAG: fatty acyl-AMP ligase [Alphaproteobacteria bacterium]|nr:fatty acyl-AMP ligase [Alphaproteobacteria bacterium]